MTTKLFREKEEWWATLESNQAWVSPAELQSAAAPCSTSPAEPFGVGASLAGVAGGVKRISAPCVRGAMRAMKGASHKDPAHGRTTRKAQETHLGD